jgi:diacylglycerol kinase family enzyme
MESSIARRPPLLVLNPNASDLRDAERRARVAVAAAAAIRQRCGREPEVVDGTHAEALAALSSAADRPLVVVAGGDGSVREAAAVLAGTDVTLAVIPGGTGNVLAHAVKVGGQDRALAAIRTGVARRLDLGVASWPDADGSAIEQVFVVACGMGLDARIMIAAEAEWKRRLRFGAYVGAAIKEATRLDPALFRIVADGEELEITGLVALVANCGEIVPGRVGARQPLDPTDGRLDLIVAGGRGGVDGIHGVAQVLLRRGELDGSVIRRLVRRVSIQADPAQPRQVDGDPHPPGPLEARVLPGAVRLLLPA